MSRYALPGWMGGHEIEVLKSIACDDGRRPSAPGVSAVRSHRSLSWPVFVSRLAMAALLNIYLVTSGVLV